MFANLLKKPTAERKLRGNRRRLPDSSLLRLSMLSSSTLRSAGKFLAIVIIVFSTIIIVIIITSILIIIKISIKISTIIIIISISRRVPLCENTVDAVQAKSVAGMVSGKPSFLSSSSSFLSLSLSLSYPSSLLLSSLFVYFQVKYFNSAASNNLNVLTPICKVFLEHDIDDVDDDDNGVSL